MTNYLEILENLSPYTYISQYAETRHHASYESTWVCPKSGKWKIICIGSGGGLANPYYGTGAIPHGTIQNSGSTSFAGLLTALGGKSIIYPVNIKDYSETIKFYEGFIPSDPSRYNKPMDDIRVKRPLGYGSALFPAEVGQISMGIFELEANKKYSYIIGNDAFFKANDSGYSMQMAFDYTYELPGPSSSIRASETAQGGLGAIILQYLGE